MSTCWFGEDVDAFVAALKDLVADRDGYLVVTNGIHGQVLAGSKRNPRLRVPMSYSTDILAHPESIPMRAVWLGLMILPKDSAVVPPEDEAEQSGGAK